eukprot:3636911-Prorocentrum_lima.AAC.1
MLAETDEELDGLDAVPSVLNSTSSSQLKRQFAARVQATQAAQPLPILPPRTRTHRSEREKA